MLAPQNAAPEPVEVPGATLVPEPVDAGAAILDLTLYTWERSGGGWRRRWSTPPTCSRPRTAERMAAHLVEVLRAVAARPGAAPWRRSRSSLPAERAQLLAEWNAAGGRLPAERCLHELFAEQAARTPDAAAIRFAGRTTTYAELERSANRLARHLRALGVGPEARVGLCVERTPEMVAAMLGDPQGRRRLRAARPRLPGRAPGVHAGGRRRGRGGVARAAGGRASRRASRACCWTRRRSASPRSPTPRPGCGGAREPGVRALHLRLHRPAQGRAGGAPQRLADRALPARRGPRRRTAPPCSAPPPSPSTSRSARSSARSAGAGRWCWWRACSDLPRVADGGGAPGGDRARRGGGAAARRRHPGERARLQPGRARRCRPRWRASCTRCRTWSGCSTCTGLPRTPSTPPGAGGARGGAGAHRAAGGRLAGVRAGPGREPGARRRGGGAVPGRSRGRARLPRPPGADGGAVRPGPVRGRAGRADVPHRRPGALAGRRGAGVPGPHGPAGQGARLPHRARRGGGRAAGSTPPWPDAVVAARDDRGGGQRLVAYVVAAEGRLPPPASCARGCGAPSRSTWCRRRSSCWTRFRSPPAASWTAARSRSRRRNPRRRGRRVPPSHPRRRRSWRGSGARC